MVFAIGESTQIGMISKKTQSISKEKSTLDIQLNKVVKFVSILGVIMGILSYALILYIGELNWQLAFLFALSIIVSNIPEGLLPTVNLSLSLGVQRMAKENALVKRLSSVETLSGTTVICTDKTGTLTKNQLTVQQLWGINSNIIVGDDIYKTTENIISKTPEDTDFVNKLLTAGIVCNETKISQTPDTEFNKKGNPTDIALLQVVNKYGFNAQQVNNQFQFIDLTPFSSENKKMSAVVNNTDNPFYNQNTQYTFTKGAHSILINTCTHYYKNNQITALTSNQKQQVLVQNDKFAKSGFRVIAFCVETMHLNKKVCMFLGLMAINDPPREEVKQAVMQCKQAGIKITVISGDYGLTVASIAQQVGIIENENYKIVNGAELDKLNDQQLQLLLQNQHQLIFARTTPQHKLRIVEAYKHNDEVVAVTGDGINDILALKSAHIGIAMGKGGTEVAREAADMILLDDNFATIVKGIKESRGIYANIKKFITYIFVSNIPELIPVLAMGFFGIPPALTILQILAIDLGTDIIPALALGSENPSDKLLTLPPRKKTDTLINKNMFLRSYGFVGVIEATLLMALFIGIFYQNGISFSSLQALNLSILNLTASPQINQVYIYATTMALASIVFSQIGNLFACRSETQSFIKSFKNKNPLIFIGIFAEIAILLLIIYVPFLQNTFHTTALAPTDFLILLLCPVIILLFEETRKLLLKLFTKNKPRSFI